MAKVKKFLKTKSLRRQWVFSYLCMLLVTVIVIIAVYILSAINIKKDRESNISINTKALENLQIYIDDKWSELISFYYDLTRDSSFVKIVNSSELQEGFRSEVITFLLGLNNKKIQRKLVMLFTFQREITWFGMEWYIPVKSSIKPKIY